MFKDNPKLKNIFFAGFLFSLSLALTAYINSSFLSLYFSEKSVGLLYTLGFIVSIVALLFIPKILIKIGSFKFLLWSAAINALALLLLATAKSPGLIIPAFVSYLTLNTIIVFSLDELLQIFSKNSAVGKIRGFYLAIISSSWVITQSVSGMILFNFSFSVLYFISFIIMAIFLA